MPGLQTGDTMVKNIYPVPNLIELLCGREMNHETNVCNNESRAPGRLIHLSG